MQRTKEDKEEVGNLIAEITSTISAMEKDKLTPLQITSALRIRSYFHRLGQLNDTSKTDWAFSLHIAVVINKVTSKYLNNGEIKTVLIDVFPKINKLIKWNENGLGRVYILLNRITRQKYYLTGDDQMDHNRHHFINHAKDQAEVLKSIIESKVLPWFVDGTFTDSLTRELLKDPIANSILMALFANVVTAEDRSLVAGDDSVKNVYESSKQIFELWVNQQKAESNSATSGED